LCSYFFALVAFILLVGSHQRQNIWFMKTDFPTIFRSVSLSNLLKLQIEVKCMYVYV